jgi:hypothetical protein
MMLDDMQLLHAAVETPHLSSPHNHSYSLSYPGSTALGASVYHRPLHI